MEGTWPVFESRALKAVSVGLSAPLIRLLSALFGLIRVGILLKSKSHPCRSVTTATFDWRRPGKPEHGGFECQSVSFECHWGANRGHLPLEKVTYASVGPPCVSVICVSLRLDLPSVGPAPV